MEILIITVIFIIGFLPVIQMADKYNIKKGQRVKKKDASLIETPKIRKKRDRINKKAENLNKKTNTASDIIRAYQTTPSGTLAIDFPPYEMKEPKVPLSELSESDKVKRYEKIWEDDFEAPGFVNVEKL